MNPAPREPAPACGESLPPPEPQGAVASAVPGAPPAADPAPGRRPAEELAHLLAHIPVIVARMTPAGIFTYVNRTVPGLAVEDVLGRNVMEFVAPEERERMRGILERAAHTGEAFDFEMRGVGAHGTLAWYASRFAPVVEDGRVVELLGVTTDITERRRLEEQLLRAQKMESIGRLAGGLAHDFNNLLTAILGFTELATLNLPEDAPAQSDLKNVRSVAQRGTALTRQLMAFASRQRSEPHVFRLRELVTGAERMLRRLVGDHVGLVVRPQAQEDVVKADPAQVEQVLVNLVVNARDAMPYGGTLTVASEDVVLTVDDVRDWPDAVPGAHVVLSVQDTGVGMSEEVQKHAFEPFFTTKGPDRGTGLGLASCYGMVRQNGGHIRVFSRPGEGTTFRIFLPRDPGPPVPLDLIVAPGLQGLGGQETILLAEDDPQVRQTMMRALSEGGYRVIAAENGEQALERAKAHAEPIDLVISDVVMPRMVGPELCERLRRVRPGVKVLFVSGHTEQQIIPEGSPAGAVEFLQKPFVPSELLQRVRGMLAGGR